MTVSNNSLQGALMNAVSNPLDGPDSAAPMGGEANSLQLAGVEQGSEDFWKILHQNFPDLDPAAESQLTESVNVSGIFQGLDVSLDDASAMPAEWMQFLKSHFAEASTAPGASTAAESMPGVELTLSTETPTTVPLMSVAALQEATENGGEELPLQRQEFSPGKGQQVTASLVMQANPATLKGTAGESISALALQPEQASAKADAQASDVDMALLDAEGNSKDSAVVDKFIARQAMSESAQNAGKTTESITAAQASQAGGAALQASSSVTQSTLPTALQTMQLSPAAPPAQWGEAIGERVTFLINQKLNNAEIRLDPPHLGKLDIQIQIKDDSAVVVIQTQQAQTRDLIDSAAYRLREFLQDAGYSSVDVSVSHQEQSFAGEGSDQQSEQSAQLQDDQAQAGSENELAMQQHDIQFGGQGRIDYFA